MIRSMFILFISWRRNREEGDRVSASSSLKERTDLICFTSKGGRRKDEERISPSSYLKRMEERISLSSSSRYSLPLLRRKLT